LNTQIEGSVWICSSRPAWKLLFFWKRGGSNSRKEKGPRGVESVKSKICLFLKGKRKNRKRGEIGQREEALLVWKETISWKGLYLPKGLLSERKGFYKRRGKEAGKVVRGAKACLRKKAYLTRILEVHIFLLRE